ncbi:MAG: hypothetical protein HGB12_00235 [Bacteroidetes bacterium]|nr:hypothetical protein [Bacteroidota bacterium]
MADLGTVLFGDQGKKDKLQNQINALQTQINNTIDSTLRQNLLGQLAALKGQLATYMNQQGATDASGRLYRPNEVQNDYLNKDYLAMRTQQAGDTAQLGLAQAIKQGKQMQLQGMSNYNPAAVASQIENTARTNQNSLANDVYNEQNMAYGKANEDLSRRTAYAQTLSQNDRQNILDQFNSQIAMLGISSQQQANLQNQLNSMPDGLLVDLAKVGVKAGVDWLLGKIK